MGFAAAMTEHLALREVWIPALAMVTVLLFHDFVDGDAVDVGHFVEFVDADDTAVGEHHCSGFEAAFAGFFVGSHCGRETYP